MSGGNQFGGGRVGGICERPDAEVGCEEGAGGLELAEDVAGGVLAGAEGLMDEALQGGVWEGCDWGMFWDAATYAWTWRKGSSSLLADIILGDWV